MVSQKQQLVHELFGAALIECVDHELETVFEVLNLKDRAWVSGETSYPTVLKHVARVVVREFGFSILPELYANRTR